jgi:hypothetical protein
MKKENNMCKKDQCQQKCKSCIKNYTDAESPIKPYNIILEGNPVMDWKEQQRHDDIILEIETLCKGITSAERDKRMEEVLELVKELQVTLTFAEKIGVDTDAYKHFIR